MLLRFQKQCIGLHNLHAEFDHEWIGLSSNALSEPPNDIAPVAIMRDDVSFSLNEAND